MSGFGFGGAPATGGGNGNGNEGDALPDRETDELTLQDVTLQTGNRVQISSPWTTPPPPFASLLSVASRRGLLAAAGPESLVIADTATVRKQYIPRRESGKPKHTPIAPISRLPTPRLSHVAFSSDESCLVIASEQGGGLAVYDTNSLVTGSKESSFQIATNGVSVRHLLPNPNSAPEFAHQLAVVLSNGQLLLADLKTRSLVDGPNGKVFKDGVVSAAWSKLGKQIIAGLQDSTCARIDPQGKLQDTIPIPPQLPRIQQEEYESAQALPVTRILWLETHKFLIVYSPFNGPSDPDAMPPREDSIYILAERQKGSPFAFRRFDSDPCPAFGDQTRTPANHYLMRLGEWNSSLSDLIIASSTASSDIGLLASFAPVDGYVTAMPNEAGRATLPMSESSDGNDASPIGMAVDFSAIELAPRPIPSETDTFENAPMPLPCLCLVDIDGNLSMWWVVYADSIRQNISHPSIVNRTGPYLTYKELLAASGDGDDQDKNGNGERAATGVESQKSAAPQQFTTTSAFRSTTFGQSTPTQPSAPKTTFGGSSALGQSSSPWGSSPSAAPAASSGAAFGQTSQIGGSKPAFGQSTFGKPSAPVSGFGQVSAIGSNISSPLAPSSAATKSPFGATPTGGFAVFANKGAMSPFAGFSSKTGDSTTASPFGGAGKTTQSPFAAAAQNGSKTSAFSSFGRESSTGSTATLGSGNSGFGQPSAPFSSFGSKPALSKESTMGDGDKPSNGLTGLGPSGFSLGSTFKGDGSAKDDLPKPSNPGGSLFGSDFGKSLGGMENDKPVIKQEPEDSGGDAPLPPDPTDPKFKRILADMPPPPGQESKARADDAPLPPDFTKIDYKKALADLPPVPGQETITAPVKEKDKEVPLAGSPPQDITHSQTFSSGASETALPDEEGSEDWDEEDEGDDDEEGEDDEEYESEDRSQEDELNDLDTLNEQSAEGSEDERDNKPYQVQDQKALNGLLSRITPKDTTTPAPRSPESTKAKGDSTTPTSNFPKPSYTPAGFPQGPTLQPTAHRKTDGSPRSPSPQRQPQYRSVTSPMPKPALNSGMTLPTGIKVTAVPPAIPVEREKSVPSPKPREPTAGELEDEHDARVQELLIAPVEPSKEMPQFYTHTDYAGTVKIAGAGAQIEKLFRDINSMINVVGLNARSLNSFLDGHEKLRKEGSRTREDLEDADAWTLDEARELDRVMNHVYSQLENGKLDNVSSKLDKVNQEQQESLKIKAKTVEMRRQLATYTDPERRAELGAAPLSADTAAQQSELRHGLQRVQKLLSEVEEKMTLLRVDLSSLSNSANTTSRAAPVPTVEAVERTILKMTAMVEQKSGDIDLLESQITRLPNGIASLHMADDYEDDLAARLGSSKLLLNDSPSRSRRTPPSKYPRMAANGDALGMSGMFGSRFQTPPPHGGSPGFGASARASVRFTPEASKLGRSTGSLGGSARKKMVDVTEEEIEAFQARKARRETVLGALKSRVENGGVRSVKAE